MSDTDMEAFSINVRNELTTCQSRLIADFTAVISKQHETLLKDLVGQLNGSNLRACTNIAEAVPPALCQVSVPQHREVLAAQVAMAQDQTPLEVESTDQSPKKPPPFRAEAVNISDEVAAVGNHQHNVDDIDDMSSNAEVIEGKERSNFSSIFAVAIADHDLEEAHYRVEDFYYTEGWAQWLARDERFSNLTLGIIALNAVYIGIDADWNSADVLFDAHPFFIFMDNAFCFFFSFELLVRFLAFKNTCSSIKDGWFKFDSFLVILMVMETWVMAPIVGLVSGGGISIPVQPLRLLRLLRLTRMTRLLRSLPELVTMTRSMKIATRAVLSSLLMVVLLIYTFAIVLNMGLKEEDDVNEALAPRNFRTIPRTMLTLLMDGTFMDSTGSVLTTLLFSGNPVCWMACLVFMAFILFTAITVMNMLIGVLCEVVSAVAQAEKDEADIVLAKESILVELKKFCNDDGKINMVDLMHVFADKKSKNVLKSLNIDQLFLTELQQLLFTTPDSVVSVRTIMELMLMCRGDLPVTVQHIASQQATLFCSLQKLEQRLIHQLHELRHMHMFAAQSAPILEKIHQTTEQPHVCVLTEDVNLEPLPLGKVLAQEGVNLEYQSIRKAPAQEDVNVDPLPIGEALAQEDVNSDPLPVGKTLAQEDVNVEHLPIGEVLAQEDVNAESLLVGKALAQECVNVEPSPIGEAKAQEDVNAELSLGATPAQEDANVEHSLIQKALAQEDVIVEHSSVGKALAQEDVHVEHGSISKAPAQEDVNVEPSPCREALAQEDANAEPSPVGKTPAQEEANTKHSLIMNMLAQEDVNLERSSFEKVLAQPDVLVEHESIRKAPDQEDVNLEPLPSGQALTQVNVNVESSPIEIGSHEDYLTPEDTPRQDAS